MKKIVGLTSVFLFLFSINLAAFAGSPGILQGNYSVYKDGKIADKLMGKNPLVEDSLLVCNGKCIVNANGINLVAAENAIFAVKNRGDQFNLLVKQGRVDFTLLNTSHKIAFFTPDGRYTVGNGIVRASSTGSSLRGFMQVVNGKAEVGLYDGSMVLATGDGPKTINANEKIILAMAEIPDEGGAAPENGSGSGSFWSQHKIPIIATGVVVAGTGIGVGVALANDDDDDDDNDEASPSK